MNYKSFNLGDWIDHISGVIEDENTLDGNEMRDLVEFLSGLPKWIPVSEKLPKEHIFEDGYVGPSDKVQITTVHGTVTTSRYWGNRWSKVTEEAEGRSPEYYDWVEAELWEDDVLAWMPLPEPYKVESER